MGRGACRGIARAHERRDDSAARTGVRPRPVAVRAAGSIRGAVEAATADHDCGAAWPAGLTGLRRRRRRADRSIAGAPDEHRVQHRWTSAASRAGAYRGPGMLARAAVPNPRRSQRAAGAIRHRQWRDRPALSGSAADTLGGRVTTNVATWIAKLRMRN